MELSENKIGELLRLQLKDRYSKILLRKYPSNSPRIKKFLSEQLGYVPFLRPEIDMVFAEKSGQLNAAELKFFKRTDFGYRMPFYKGIDQALSLFRYGFDNAALWHFFSPDISLDDINKYGAETWFFIRNSLQLRLNFTYFRIVEADTGPRFRVMQYLERNKGFSLGKFVDDPDFWIAWRYGNPLVLAGDLITLKIREALVRNYLLGY